MISLSDFSEIVCVDFEFLALEGERPNPICFVAQELRSQRLTRFWIESANPPRAPLFPVDREALFVAYLASAEMGCFLSLGWQLPQWVLDLFAEFRVETNGLHLPCGNGLLGALQWFGLDAMEGAKKDLTRKRILSGGSFSIAEQKEILDYCQADVESLVRLLPKLVGPSTDLQRPLLRGEYMKTVACAEHTGIPVDLSLFRRLKAGWQGLKETVAARTNETIPVFKGKSFNHSLFEQWLGSQDLLEDWPRTRRDCRLAVDEDTFREKVRVHPVLEPLWLTLQVLNQLHELKLSVGEDGRNRCLLSPFATKTGRNAPSTTKNIFGAPSFLRSLIQPGPGKALAYVDWSQQEFAIAALLSGDAAMQRAYESGDPYLASAKAAAYIPKDATKRSHPKERDLFKIICLGTQYGMSAYGLSHRLECTLAEAQDLLDLHRRTFPDYWIWVEAASDLAQLRGYIESTFGWRLWFSDKSSARSLHNWPMQANGAEMLRCACIAATRAGISILAPVHDALLIEADEAEIDDVVFHLQGLMEDAGRLVLSGFTVRSEAQIIRPPARFHEDRGLSMWNWLLDALGSEA